MSFTEGAEMGTFEGLTKFDKTTHNVKHNAGEVILIDFWATWCPPCQRPMAHNQEMLVKNAASWGTKVRIIGISLDDSTETVDAHVKSKGWTTVEHYWDGPSGASDKWGIQGIPNCALVGKDGKITWRGHPGSVDLEAKINEELRK